MRPQLWQQVDQLFHAALEHEPLERDAFLDRECAGQNSLRNEVMKLLAAHEAAGSFMEQPALDVEARSVANNQSVLTVGQTIGHYRIASQLGAGGMGEVYLAEDTTLGRKVALKLLPADFVSDKDRVRRFQQEAHAASALNHPNIVTIHEIAHVDDRYLIATEFIDGETLRERILETRSHNAEGDGDKSGTPLPLREVLNIGIQVADALSAAHEAGIVHRDIKPENIMVRRRDGYIKVLDFGLAKLSQPAMAGGPNVDREAATRPQVQTSAGLVMGTLTYMSPEQTRGEQVDQRTDIWSLGVVLYELVAGCAPFERPTPSEIIAAILDREPPPLTQYVREVPAEFERIISKALTKEKEQRYHTAKDFLIDLRDLQHRLEIDAEIVRSTNRESRPDLTERPSTGSDGLVSAAKDKKRSAASIAVLPFVNMSADPENEFFCDGLAEELLNALTKIGELKVAARSSAFSFKGKNANVNEIGVALGVNQILEGSVRKSGEQLRITVQLINASDGYHVWSERYDRLMRDIFGLQDEITIAVIDALKVKLLGNEKAAVLKRHTENAQAYELYLKGRHFLNRRTAEGFTKAIEQFQQAVDKDPNYALAYAGLADCYSVMQVYVSAPQSEMLPKAKAAAVRALQLDDSLAEAHASLGWIHLLSWRWRDAEEEFKRAIQLNPKYSIVHVWYSIWLNIMGKLDEAMREVERAQELDPLLPALAGNLPRIQILRGDLEAAIAFCNNAVELDPTYHYVHVILALAYQKQGRYEEAIEEAQKGVELSRRASGYLAPLGYCYAVAGRRSEALAILTELEKKHTGGGSPGVSLAWVHAGLGDKEQAFAWLEKDLQDASGQLAFLITGWPMLDTLRSDPRWNNLLRRMGLPIELRDREDERKPPVRAGPPDAEAISEAASSPYTATAEYIVNQVKRHKVATFVSLLVVTLAVAMTAALLWYFKPAGAGPILTDKDTILLADFENKTGDEVFDGALKQALAVQLGQSPFLSIFPDSSVRQTLNLMRRSPDERVTGEIAREICERQGLKAFIAGSIASFGSHYVLTLEVVNGHTAEVLAREQTEADSKEQILKSLSQVATKLRERLGESLSSVERFSKPLGQSTTSSLEAFRAASLGAEWLRKGGDLEGIRFFKRAIELDPNFASAYLMLAITYSNMGSESLRKEYAAKAFALRDQVSEHERLVIEIWYYLYVSREVDRHIEALEVLTETYPREEGGPFSLSNVHFNLGQFDRALEEAREAIRRNPKNAWMPINLAQAFIPFNHFDEAREASDRALQQQYDAADVRGYLYQIAFVGGDSAGMQQQLDWAKGKPVENVALDWQSDTAAFAGQWQKAQDFSRRSIELATRGDMKDQASASPAKVAAFTAVFGQCVHAKQLAAQALALNQSERPPAHALIGLALCGESTRASQRADEYDRRYPKDTLFNGPWLPSIGAAVELQRGKAARAIELLEAGMLYEGASQFWSPYLRGQAYLKLKRGAEAATEFQKILDHRGQAPLSALYPLAHLGLARAASLMRDTEKSRKAYETFFSLWKDADPDIPILQQARREYTKLK